MKSGINGARWWRANAGVLLTRNTPLASALAAGLSDASACSSAAMTFCGADKKRSPSWVSWSTREVR